jgi:hypothetical protein
MIRRKGQVTQRQIDRDFPHQVAIKIPAADRIREIHEFCHTRRHYQPPDRRRRMLEVVEYTRFCFADHVDADAFVARFGGVRIRTLPRLRDNSLAKV